MLAPESNAEKIIFFHISPLSPHLSLNFLSDMIPVVLFDFAPGMWWSCMCILLALFVVTLLITTSSIYIYRYTWMLVLSRVFFISLLARPSLINILPGPPSPTPKWLSYLPFPCLYLSPPSVPLLNRMPGRTWVKQNQDLFTVNFDLLGRGGSHCGQFWWP